jgi:hypothetical protein
LIGRRDPEDELMTMCLDLASSSGGSPLDWFRRPVGELVSWVRAVNKKR